MENFKYMIQYGNNIVAAFLYLYDANVMMNNLIDQGKMYEHLHSFAVKIVYDGKTIREYIKLADGK